MTQSYAKESTTDDIHGSLSPITADVLVQRVRREGVVGQDEFVEWFAQQLVLQIARIQAYRSGVDESHLLNMSAIAVTGPTASGKTFIVRAFALALGLSKIFYIDCSSLTGSGWRGANVANSLKEVADYQVLHPELPIIVLWDEFDKLVKGGDYISDGFDPQRNLLGYLDGGTYSGESDDSNRTSFELDTNYVINVFSGAFTGIEKHVRRRLGLTQSYGLVPSTNKMSEINQEGDARKYLTIDDLISYGLMREFAGRISSVMNIFGLSLDDLTHIICHAPNNLQSRCKTLLPQGVTLTFTAEATKFLAHQALKSSVGARALEQNVLGTLGQANAEVLHDRAISHVFLDAKDGGITVQYCKEDGYTRPVDTRATTLTDRARTAATKQEVSAFEEAEANKNNDNALLHRNFPYAIDDACAAYNGSEQLAKMLLAEDATNKQEEVVIKNAELLLTSCLAFVAKHGDLHEQNICMVDYLLGGAGPTNDETIYDCMIRQIEKGERYDKNEHKWVKDQTRQPAPDDLAVVKFHEYTKLPLRAKRLAWKYAHLQLRSNERTLVQLQIHQKLKRLLGRTIISTCDDGCPSGYLEMSRDSRRTFANAAKDLRVKKSELIDFCAAHYQNREFKEFNGKYCEERRIRAFLLSRGKALQNYKLCTTCNRYFHEDNFLFNSCEECFSTETELCKF